VTVSVLTEVINLRDLKESPHTCSRTALRLVASLPTCTWGEICARMSTSETKLI